MEPRRLGEGRSGSSRGSRGSGSHVAGRPHSSSSSTLSDTSSSQGLGARSGVPGSGGGSGSGSASRLTVDALAAAADQQLASGLAAAEEQLKQSTPSSKSDTAESETRDSLKATQQFSSDTGVSQTLSDQQKKFGQQYGRGGSRSSSSVSGAKGASSGTHSSSARQSQVLDPAQYSSATSNKRLIADLQAQLMSAEGDRVMDATVVESVTKIIEDSHGKAATEGAQNLVADLAGRLQTALIDVLDEDRKNEMLHQNNLRLQESAKEEEAKLLEEKAKTTGLEQEIADVKKEAALARAEAAEKVAGIAARTEARADLDAILQSTPTTESEKAEQAAAILLFQKQREGLLPVVGKTKVKSIIPDVDDQIGAGEGNVDDLHQADINDVLYKLDASTAAKEEVTLREHKRKVASLAMRLSASRESQRHMAEQLSQLRMEMLSGKSQESGGSSSSSSSSSRGGGGGNLDMSYRRRPPQPQRTAPPKMLSAIDEEGDDNESIGGGGSAAGGSAVYSGAISSEGDAIADQRDFDDGIQFHEREPAVPGPAGSLISEHEKQKDNKIESLTTQLIEVHLAKAELKEDMKDSEAQLAAKVDRLQNLLESSEAKNDAKENELWRLQCKTASESKIASTVETLQSQLNQQKQEKDRLQVVVEEKDKSQAEETSQLHEEIHEAKESKRIALIRFEDLKQEMANAAARHEKMIEGLKAQIKAQQSSSGVSPGGDGGEEDDEGVPIVGSAEETASVRKDLLATVEERNMLTHTLEWKEVQWKTKLETMEMEHAADMAEIKKKHKEQVATLKKQMKEQMAEATRDLQQKLLAAQSSVGKAAAAKAEQTQSVWTILAASMRCPTRAAVGDTDGGDGSIGAACAQDVTWRVVNSMNAIMAVLCDFPNLAVKDASREASLVFGNLQGRTLVNMLSGSTRAMWLQKAIRTHQDLAEMHGGPESVPGFAIHPLGRLQFKEASGRSVDFTVTVSHLPAEPILGKPCMLLVVLEPMPGERQHSSKAQREIGGHQQASSSSVVSADVTPSDSVSNVMYNPHMW
eukprot:TRINITY_DN11239_c0_g1_i1.p1 TRINITY_DN11239_c0_g1~~TRINITY_DN11239_c0_g1_i1.p1  ORF type:complete len:1039 (-),score=295.83 TRINITY_DN11239_c0_g1_i1:194-3310(-)